MKVWNRLLLYRFNIQIRECNLLDLFKLLLLAGLILLISVNLMHFYLSAEYKLSMWILPIDGKPLHNLGLCAIGNIKRTSRALVS